jgi:hypothetical protein
MRDGSEMGDRKMGRMSSKFCFFFLLPSSSFILHPSSFIPHPSSFILSPGLIFSAHFGIKLTIIFDPRDKGGAGV